MVASDEILKKKMRSHPDQVVVTSGIYAEWGATGTDDHAVFKTGNYVV
jgi:hypothetical protein